MATGYARLVIGALNDLSDDELLEVQREVCRKAAAIYGPMHEEKRAANQKTGIAAMAKRRG